MLKYISRKKKKKKTHPLNYINKNIIVNDMLRAIMRLCLNAMEATPTMGLSFGSDEKKTKRSFVGY
jgi:hypothetical protein